MVKKKIFIFVFVAFIGITGLLAQPLSVRVGSDHDMAVAKIDSNTLHWRNKLYPKTDAGELNIYGFNPGEIPVYSDSTYAFRLSVLETEIPLEYNKQVRAYIDLYANRRRGLISKVLSTSKFYFPIFEEVFDRENVPMEFKYVAVIESARNQRAISPVGAAGLWQARPVRPDRRLKGAGRSRLRGDARGLLQRPAAAPRRRCAGARG